MIILNVNKITKDYGFGELLKDISFTLNEGEKVAVVGENGCGKSTLLKMIAGIESCKFGSISIKKEAIFKFKDGKCFNPKQIKTDEVNTKTFEFDYNNSTYVLSIATNNTSNVKLTKLFQ